MLPDVTTPSPSGKHRSTRLTGEYSASIDALAALDGHPDLLELMYSAKALQAPKLLSELRDEAIRENARRAALAAATTDAERSRLRGTYEAEREMFGLRFRMSASLESHRASAAQSRVYTRLPGGGIVGLAEEDAASRSHHNRRSLSPGSSSMSSPTRRRRQITASSPMTSPTLHRQRNPTSSPMASPSRQRKLDSTRHRVPTSPSAAHTTPKPTMSRAQQRKSDARRHGRATEKKNKRLKKLSHEPTVGEISSFDNEMASTFGAGPSPVRRRRASATKGHNELSAVKRRVDDPIFAAGARQMLQGRDGPGGLSGSVPLGWKPAAQDDLDMQKDLRRGRREQRHASSTPRRGSMIEADELEKQRYYDKREKAAVEIQRVARGKIGRKRFNDEWWETAHNEAAERIQSIARGRQARRTVQQIKREKEAAAVAIQRVARGRAARKRVAEMRKQLEADKLPFLTEEDRSVITSSTEPPPDIEEATLMTCAVLGLPETWAAGREFLLSAEAESRLDKLDAGTLTPIMGARVRQLCRNRDWISRCQACPLPIADLLCSWLIQVATDAPSARRTGIISDSDRIALHDSTEAPEGVKQLASLVCAVLGMPETWESFRSLIVSAEAKSTLSDVVADELPEEIATRVRAETAGDEWAERARRCPIKVFTLVTKWIKQVARDLKPLKLEQEKHDKQWAAAGGEDAAAAEAAAAALAALQAARHNPTVADTLADFDKVSPLVSAIVDLPLEAYSRLVSGGLPAQAVAAVLGCVAVLFGHTPSWQGLKDLYTDAEGLMVRVVTLQRGDVPKRIMAKVHKLVKSYNLVEKVRETKNVAGLRLALWVANMVGELTEQDAGEGLVLAAAADAAAGIERDIAAAREAELTVKSTAHVGVSSSDAGDGDDGGEADASATATSVGAAIGDEHGAEADAAATGGAGGL